MDNPYKKAFLKVFSEVDRTKHRYTVFSDFCNMSAISLSNVILRNDSIEREYHSYADRYEKKYLDKMPELFSLVVKGLEFERCDFLGELFMELELGCDRKGQVFTPFHICQLMAELSFVDSKSLLESNPFITTSDPCCGAGAMTIALAETMLKHGFNPQEKLWVNCIDIDQVAASMAMIQLSLLNIPGEIVVGNSLTLEITKVMRTPAHYLGRWNAKLGSNIILNKSRVLKKESVNTATPLSYSGEIQLGLF